MFEILFHQLFPDEHSFLTCERFRVTPHCTSLYRYCTFYGYGSITWAAVDNNKHVCFATRSKNILLPCAGLALSFFVFFSPGG